MSLRRRLSRRQHREVATNQSARDRKRMLVVVVILGILIVVGNILAAKFASPFVF